MPTTIGIDLGTTYSAAAIISPGGVPEMLRNSDGDNTTPSVVLFDGQEVVVGKQAKMQAARDLDNVVSFVKRQMGNPDWRFYGPDEHAYTPEEISAIILKRIASDAALSLGEPVAQVAITVPAYFTDDQRLATRHAGEIAGLDVIAIVNEPTAAALSFGIEHNFNGTVLVYDLGGGTFDVTILKCHEGAFDILATEGRRNLGGFDFDNAIIEWARGEFGQRTGLELDELALADLRERAEQAKHRLSMVEAAPLYVTYGGATEKLVVTREKFEALTAALLAETGYLIESVLEAAELSADRLDKVLLVGGSTRMPMVSRLVESITLQTPDQSVHPDEAVARGAALVADLRTADASGSAPRASRLAGARISDVVSHGLGLSLLDEHGVLTNTVVVPANSTIPSQHVYTAATAMDGQVAWKVEVNEGEETDLRYVKHIGTTMLQFEPRPESHPMGVVFSCDLDGILHIRVTDGVTGADLGEFEIDRTSNLALNEIETMRAAMANLEVR